jgi:drug/metabolite transporter (DMT)-like permease
MAIMGSSVRVSSALVHAPLLVAQALRYAAAAAVLAGLRSFGGTRDAPPIVVPRGREWAWLLGVSATGLVGFNLAVVRGLAYAQPAAIAVVLACIPIGLALAGPLVGQRPAAAGALLGALVVTAGSAMVEGAGSTSLAGAACAVAALLSEICFTLLAVPVLGRLGAWGVSFHATWMAAAMFGGLSLVLEGAGAASRLSGGQWAAAGGLALMTVAAFVCWYSAIGRLGTASAGLLTGAAPVAAAAATALTGGPAPGLLGFGGMLVVCAGLALGSERGELLSRPRPR